MSQQFPNPHGEGPSSAQLASSGSPAFAQSGSMHTGTAEVYDHRQMLPAVPRTVSAPQTWQQADVPTLGRPASLVRSASGTSSGTGPGYGYSQQQHGARPYPVANQPASAAYPSYGHVAPRPVPTPYGIAPSQRPPSSAFATGQSARPWNPVPHQQPMAVHRPGQASGGQYPTTNRPHSAAAAQQTFAEPHRFPQPSENERSPPTAPARRQDSLELEAAMQASEASARAEEERRQKLHAEEEAQILALSRREEETRRQKRQEEEEQELQRVMEASRREEEEQERKRQQQREEEELHSQVLLEESRQHALREEEARIQREHSDILTRSKAEALAAEDARRRAQEEEKQMEEAAIRESLREMEEEWRRREEAERASQEFLAQGGNLGAATYWRHLNQDAAYELAVNLERRASTLSQSTVSTVHSVRRPLPPTPDASEHDARQGEPSPQYEHAEFDTPHMMGDHEMAGPAYPGSEVDSPEEREILEDPFTDHAEAPPMYDEAHSSGTYAQGEHRLNAQTSQTLIPNSGLDESATYTSPEAIPLVTSLPIPSLHVQRERELPAIPTSMEMQATEREGILSPGEPVASPRDTHTLGTVPEDAVMDASQTESAGPPMQRAMKSTEYGYALEPFSPDLDALGTFEHGRFPNLIRLRCDKGDGTLAEPMAYFVIRAPSWKALLRALAWYGNTRIEAGPEEVVDNPAGLCLRIEAEFITPVKATLPNARKAFASVCISLLTPDNADAKAADAQSTALKNASRALDASHVRAGSTRRVIALPRRAPKLPIDLVQLARHMHEAHSFSSACPSSSHGTAVHTPQDLSYAVEKHDVKFVARVQRLRRDEEAQMARRALDSEEFVTTPGTMHLQSTPSGRRQEVQGVDDDAYEEMDAGAIDIVDGPGGESRISLSRMRERVRKRLVRRSGDTLQHRNNEELESWISESFD